MEECRKEAEAKLKSGISEQKPRLQVRL